jgi:hypothetical protein
MTAQKALWKKTRLRALSPPKARREAALLSDIDTSEPASVKQAQATLAALVATRDAAERVRSAVRA